MAIVREFRRFAGSERPAGHTRSRGERLRTWLRAGEEGQAILEMAFMAPIFLLLMLGVFKVGMIFSNQVALTQAVGSGSVFLQSSSTGTGDPCAATTSVIDAAAPQLKAANITTRYTLGGTVITNNSCTVAQIDTSGETVTVEAWYPCDFVVYGIDFSAGNCKLYAKSSQVITNSN
jgi:Flp pilus assembly protein TadG